MAQPAQHPHIPDDIALADYLLSKYTQSARTWESELHECGENWCVQQAIWHADQQCAVLRVCRDTIIADPVGGSSQTERLVVRIIAREFVDREDFADHWRELVELAMEY